MACSACEQQIARLGGTVNNNLAIAVQQSSSSGNINHSPSSHVRQFVEFVHQTGGSIGYH